MKYCTLVGSRETPEHPFRELMEGIGYWCATNGWVVRSGGAKGADTWFEQGVDRAGGRKEIYLPFHSWNCHPSPRYGHDAAGEALVRRLHPNPPRNPVKMDYLARDPYQVLGRDLQTPSVFLICWTPDGMTHYRDWQLGVSGGTAMAIAVASHYNERPDRRFDIHILNLAREDDRRKVESVIGYRDPA